MERIRLLFFLLGFGCVVASSRAADEPGTFTQNLTDAYDAAWDRGDIPTMVEMLDAECVFRSPFQTRLGREAIRENVFRNVKRFRDTSSTETLSKINEDMAYSFSESTFNDYGKTPGATPVARRMVKHIFIFTKRPGQDWKIRTMITVEEKEVPVEKEAGPK